MILVALLAYFARGEEELHIVPVDKHSVFWIFNFTSEWSFENSLVRDFQDFPQPVAGILEDSHSQYVSLGFTWGFLPQKQRDALHDIGLQGEVHDSGMFLESDLQADWDTLSHLVGGFTCSWIGALQDPLVLKDTFYKHSSEFLCKENLEAAQRLLPSATGLTTLFPYILSSKYLSLVYKFTRENEKYLFSLLVIAESPSGKLTKIPVNSKVKLYDNGKIETHSTSNVKLNRLVLAPNPDVKKEPILSRRSITDVRYEFDAVFYHEIENISAVEYDVTVYESFPKMLVPLIHTCSQPIRSILVRNKEFTLEFSLNIPKKSSVKIECSLKKKLLPFEEYPNDPQRGWDIPSTPIYYGDKKVFSNPLIVMTPEPDFAMPFNVIAITSAVLLFFFTSVQTLLLWKEKVHWSHPNYETSIVQAEKTQKIVKNVLLVIGLTILVILDRKGIIKLLG